MRMIGPVESHRGFGVQDHLCWVHSDPWDYRPRLTEFFREGLEQGLQVAYLASGNVENLREHLDLVFDMSAVQFMDHHAFLILDSYAEMCRVPVFVRSMPPIARRLAGMLSLEHLGDLRLGAL